MTDVTALRHPINQCISGTAADKMGYTTEGTIDTLNSLYLCLCYCACRCSCLLFQRDKTIRETKSMNTRLSVIELKTIIYLYNIILYVVLLFHLMYPI
jgi:hypothetical protein